jgi:hypothetical protein
MKSKRAEKMFLVVLFGVFLILLPCVSHTAIPQKINYQGSLTNAAGVPVNGTVQMVFLIYNVDTGGVALWSETQNVTVTHGVYNVNLGDITSLNLPFDIQYYLGIKVGTDPEMAPRNPLASMPYAFTATHASTASALVTDPANCPAGYVAAGINAAGDAEGCLDVASQTELDAHATLTNAHYATSSNTASRIVMRDASSNFSAGTITAALAGNASTATALASNPANCSAGYVAAGINAAGDAEGCLDVASQTELDAHATLTNAHYATSSNTASRIVMRDASGNFSAGTITASGLNVTNALTASTITFSPAKTSYYSVDGSNFLPADDTIGYGYGGQWEHYIKSGSTGPLRAPVLVPHGSRITGWSCTVFDNSSTYDVLVYIAVRNLSGGNTLVFNGYHGSSGSSSSPLVINVSSSQSVNNQNNTYFLSFATTGSCGIDCRIYGCSVEYEVTSVE